MAKHIYAQDIAAHVGEEVTIKSWLYKTNRGCSLFKALAESIGASKEGAHVNYYLLRSTKPSSTPHPC